MLTYIYLDVDECWFTSSLPQLKFKLQISFNYSDNEQNEFSWRVVDGYLSFKMEGTYHWALLSFYPSVKIMIVNSISI